MKIFTKEQFEEHNKRILSSKKEDETHSEKKDIEKWIGRVMEFFQDMEDLKEDIEEIEKELESKSDANHTHDEFNVITEKFDKIKDSITNISDEIKNIKSSIKHYDDKPLSERINTIQEEVKTLEERVSWIKIPEINLTGFLKEKDIKNLANKKEVYNKEETYNKDEVYTKKEVYNKKEIDERIKNNQWGSTSIVWWASFMWDLQDVKLTDLQDWDVPKWNATNQRFENWQWWSSWSKLLTLVWQSFTVTYNWSNQVLTQTYDDGTVSTNTYTWWVVTQTVTVFPDETTITVTYNYTWWLVSSIEYN